MKKSYFPTISVIIPCYNQEKYIAEAIDSVLDQTFQDFEIICVNDGSTDSSLSILEEYARKDKRIKVITQDNKGVIVARNNAIKQANGKYVYPLDGDDKIAPDCLEKLNECMKKGKYDVVYSQTEFFGAKTGLFELPLPDKRNMSQGNCVVCSALYKKDDWEKYGGYDIAMNAGYEDWEFWLNFIEDDKKFYRVDEALFFYRQNEGSRNSSLPRKTRRKLLKYVHDKHKKLNEFLKNENFIVRMKLFGIIPCGSFIQNGNERKGILKYLPFITTKMKLEVK